MKTKCLISLAVAVLCAALPVLSAKPRDAAGGLVKLRIDVDRAVLSAATTETAILKIALDCEPLLNRAVRSPVNLALVIDRSGSMSGDKIAKAREAALEAVRRLSPDDIVSLVAYDSSVQVLVPAQRVGDGRHLEDAIRRLQPGGSTALYGGVVHGAAEVRKNFEDQRYVNRVILLSDGLANVGPSSPQELGRLGTSLMKEGISVTTIGLGLGFNEDLMTRLAQRSDGNTYFVENSSDLPRIFADELGDVLSIVARSVVVEIEFPSGVRPLHFVGREGVIRGQRAELSLNQLYGGREKFALIEVEVAPEAAGVEREIAHARASYRDVLNGRAATLTATRSVQFSASRQAVVSSADHRVQTDYAANVLAVAKDKAVEFVDANRRDAAAAELRSKASSLEQMAATYGNAALATLSVQEKAEADRLERDGLDNAQRKTYRAENSQTVNQQSSHGGRR